MLSQNKLLSNNELFILYDEYDGLIKCLSFPKD